jgi:predicted nicotinamide N-methyase
MAARNKTRIDRARQRLLARIHHHYATRTDTVHLGPIQLRYTRIADPDYVLDQVAREEDRLEKLHGRRDADELHLPYWAEVWDSGLGIALHLVQESTTAVAPHATPAPLPLRVLDLGCGMGMAGAAAARLGARVLFADLEPPALLFAQLNSLPDAPRVRTRQLNWRTDTLGETFDLILGADILYESAQWQHLEHFWQRHLAPSGAVLLAEPGRQTGERFITWIAQRPWTLRQQEQPVPTRPNPIRLFCLTRRPPTSPT